MKHMLQRLFEEIMVHILAQAHS